MLKLPLPEELFMETNKILVAEDDPDIMEIICYTLQKGGHEVFSAFNGNEALDMARKIHPDLIILDVMMPYRNGIEVCRILRLDPLFKETCIIFLTALSDESTHIRGLETGGDDYISKPVSPKILLSRINALLRRVKKQEIKPITVGELTIDPIRFLIIKDNNEIILPKKEFELLYLLASEPGKVFGRMEILNKIWGSDVIVGDRTIDVHVRKIRQKIELDCIKTVKGKGYKFELN